MSGLFARIYLFFAAPTANSTPALCSSPLPQEKYGFPTWYKYLQGYVDPTVPDKCTPFNQANFDLTNLDSLAGIGLAVIEILLRVAAIVAIGYIVYGGFQYLVSQGEPDRAASAKNTILNALIGLVIAIFANVIVVFIGTSLTK